MASNCLSSALSLVNLTDVVRSSPGQVRDSRGWTVLHMAARHSKPQTVRLVIMQGGKLGEKDEAGNTPLHLAVGKQFFVVSKFCSSLSETIESLIVSTFSLADISIITGKDDTMLIQPC